jgi:hypothetical protein
MIVKFNVRPEPFAFEAEGEWHLERTASQPLPVRARILCSDSPR